jgi:molecular chaperone GrpE (heat shock protein)
MLPVVDLFRQAPTVVPAITEREQNMHKNFGSLLDSILNIIEKYGYKHLLECKFVEFYNSKESNASILL